jgi:hypothetical protein
MNILKYSISLAILLKCVIASESVVVKDDVIEALEEDGFGSIKQGWWEKWSKRNDLFDEVVTRDVEFIILFINQVRRATNHTLAALFAKRPDEVDQVLKEIEYSDDNLIKLMWKRPELAESHDSFFKAIDKIKEPKNQETAVKTGVWNLFNANKQGSVMPLIDALENRQFNGRNLQNAAIQQAFEVGALRGIQYFVEEFCHHPAITSERYADGLVQGWTGDTLNPVFSFLLSQADQGDLEEIKERGKHMEDQEFRKAIDGTMKTAPLAGTRHLRFFGRAKIAIITLNDLMDTEVWMQQPGRIIASYLIGEQEGTNVREKLKTMPEDVASYGIRQEQRQIEGEQDKCIVM